MYNGVSFAIIVTNEKHQNNLRRTAQSLMLSSILNTSVATVTVQN